LKPRLDIDSHGGLPWQASAGGVVLTVRLTPKGGRDAIDGIELLSDGHSVVKTRVRAPASDGAANAALINLVARALDIAPRDIALKSGAASRIKRLLIRGDTSVITAALGRVAKASAR
jgi:uncharacterized protein (TIGR00251 family)